MIEILTFLNEYSALINFVLFAAIIRILINLTKLSKESLKDKHDAELAALNSKISGLESINNSLKYRLENAAEQNQARVVLLQQQLSFFQKIADLPDNKRVEAIKIQYDTRIAELEKQSSTLQTEAKGKEVLQAKIVELQKEYNEFIKVDKKFSDAFVDLAPKIIRLMSGYLSG